MTGTEKQIAWATDIIKTAQTNVANYITRAERLNDETKDAEIMLSNYINEELTAKLNNGDASDIINNREKYHNLTIDLMNSILPKVESKANKYNVTAAKIVEIAIDHARKTNTSVMDIITYS